MVIIGQEKIASPRRSVAGATTTLMKTVQVSSNTMSSNKKRAASSLSEDTKENARDVIEQILLTANVEGSFGRKAKKRERRPSWC